VAHGLAGEPRDRHNQHGGEELMRRNFKVSDQFYCAQQVVAAGNAAIGLWTLAGAWVAAQDEAELPPVPLCILRMLHRSPEPTATKLVRLGFWSPTTDGAASEPAWSFIPNRSLYVIEPYPPYRPKISPALRERVYARDGYACLHCGTPERLSLDHIRPFSLGGRDTYDNLQTLCGPCNSSKGARV
jgi:hypothetical protein